MYRLVKPHLRLTFNLVIGKHIIGIQHVRDALDVCALFVIEREQVPIVIFVRFVIWVLVGFLLGVVVLRVVVLRFIIGILFGFVFGVELWFVFGI